MTIMQNWPHLFLIVFFLSPLTTSLIHPIVKQADLNELVTTTVNQSFSLTFQYDLSSSDLADRALRIYVEIDSDSDHLPVHVVINDVQGVLSWSLPMVSEGGGRYFSMNRTLCPTRFKFLDDQKETFYVSVSTSNPNSIRVKIVLFQQPLFHLRMDQKVKVVTAPNAPIFFHFVFPKNVDLALVKLVSDDSICMMWSVQHAQCPVQDTGETIFYEKGIGIFQSVDTKGGMTFSREQFPRGVFLVMVAKSSDRVCQDMSQLAMKPYAHKENKGDRIKSVEISIESKITRTEYLAATFGALGVFLCAYVLVLLISCVLCIRQTILPHEDEAAGEVILPENNSIEEQAREEEEEMEGPSTSGQNRVQDLNAIERAEVFSATNSSSSDFDYLSDADFEKDIFRTKPFLCVSDLARKHPRVLAKKSSLYHWNLLTVAVFYGLPVVQLMLTYQSVTNDTGNQDLCYYNFLCSHPLGFLTDFNHVFSNLGYVLLGILFMAITRRKEMVYGKFTSENPGYDKRYGLPQHFGMFYAMGLALVMEGIMSGCYHVCPSHHNFQFDTAFMYTISILILLKIYQSRHPDINANAYTAFGALAFIIFVGVIGVLYSNVYFWILFTAFHILSCLFLSLQIYYMRRWKVDCGVFRRISMSFNNDARNLLSGEWRAVLPTYPDRFVMLLVLNLVNWALSGYGVAVLAQKGGDFASFLLAIFISNVLLYTLFYMIMKLRHGEKITWQPAIYVVISCFTWAGAMYFFFNKSTSWVFPPAVSKHFNQECRLFHFYDNHDIWHFLSASSLFLSFMILLTLDDDLDNVPRNSIPVF